MVLEQTASSSSERELEVSRPEVAAERRGRAEEQLQMYYPVAVRVLLARFPEAEAAAQAH